MEKNVYCGRNCMLSVFVLHVNLLLLIAEILLVLTFHQVMESKYLLFLILLLMVCINVFI